MGINGLLPVLKSIAKEQHVSAYRGKRVAVDGYSWLHKGAYCCSRELCEGVYTDKFVRYCMSRVEMLVQNDVQPVIVFDGGRLPVKADEEESRRRSRHENKVKAQAHLAAGNTAAAEEAFQRAVSVTSCMAKQFIEALKERGVSFLVAPYEADAQMAYLALQGQVHAVITEDSDLLVYGCPRVLYKLDKHGQGEEILLENLVLNQAVSFVGFTHDMFMMTCIMAGCDFLPSLPNIGIRKAHQHMKKHRGFVKVCKHLKFSGTAVPPGYEQRFQRTLWVFRHQRVYCPAAKAMVHVQALPPGGIGAAGVDVMSAIPEGDEARTLDFLGPMMEDTLAHGIAIGEIDPATKAPFDLAAIYSGCTRLPSGVAVALGVEARPSSGAASFRSGTQSGPGPLSASGPAGPSSGARDLSVPGYGSASGSGSGSGAGSGAERHSGQGAVPHLMELGAARGQGLTKPGPRGKEWLPPYTAPGIRAKPAPGPEAPVRGSIRRFLQPSDGTRAAATHNPPSQPRKLSPAGDLRRFFFRSTAKPAAGLDEDAPPASTHPAPSYQDRSGTTFLRRPARPPQQAAGPATWTPGDELDPPGEPESSAPQQQPSSQKQACQQSRRVSTNAANGALSDVTNLTPPGLGLGCQQEGRVPEASGELQLSSRLCSSDAGFDEQYPVSSSELHGPDAREGVAPARGQRPASCAVLMGPAPQRQGGAMDYMERLRRSSEPGLLDCQDTGLDLLGLCASAKLGDVSRCRPLRAIAALSCGPSSLSQSWLSGHPDSADLAADSGISPSARPAWGQRAHAQQAPGSPSAGARAVSLSLGIPGESGGATPRSHLKRRHSALGLSQEGQPGSVAHVPSLSSPVAMKGLAFPAQPRYLADGGPGGGSARWQSRRASEPKIHAFFSKQGPEDQLSYSAGLSAVPEVNQGPGGQEMDTAAAVQQTLSCMQQRLANLVQRGPAAAEQQEGVTLGRRRHGAAKPQLPAPFAAFAAGGQAQRFGLRPTRGGAAGADALNAGQGTLPVATDDASEGLPPCPRAEEVVDAGNAPSSSGGQGGVLEPCADFHDIGHVARYEAIANQALNQVEDGLLHRFAFTGGEQRGGGAAARDRRHVPKRGLGGRGGSLEAKKPFKPPRLAKTGYGNAKTMDIKQFAYAMV